MEWVESIGDSIELAKEHALDRLGVHEDEAEFDVLSDVKAGLFGRVKEPARVRARVRPKTPRAKESRGRRDKGNRRGRQAHSNRNGNNRRNQDSGKRQRSQSDKSRSAKPGTHPSTQQTTEKAQAPQKPRKQAQTVNQDQEMMPLPHQADIAEDFVRGLADRFGTPVDFHRENIGSDEIRITVNGDELGRMVGHRGMTASAIDDLVRTVLQRRAGSARNGRVRVDVGGVIARRNEALIRFAREQAIEVRDSGVPRSLEPMNAAERKMVHDAVDGTPGVKTISEGDDPRRYVVIVPSE